MQDRELPVAQLEPVKNLGANTARSSKRAEGNATGPRIDFIDTLRGLAVLLVLWDHLVGQYLTQRGLSWWPYKVTTTMSARLWG